MKGRKHNILKHVKQIYDLLFKSYRRRFLLDSDFSYNT
jgi:hypothetical protein